MTPSAPLTPERRSTRTTSTCTRPPERLSEATSVIGRARLCEANVRAKLAEADQE